MIQVSNYFRVNIQCAWFEEIKFKVDSMFSAYLWATWVLLDNNIGRLYVSSESTYNK